MSDLGWVLAGRDALRREPSGDLRLGEVAPTVRVVIHGSVLTSAVSVGIRWNKVWSFEGVKITTRRIINMVKKTKIHVLEITQH